MYLKVIAASGSRRSSAAITEGVTIEYFVQFRTLSDYALGAKDLNDIIELLKRYPHPDHAPELDKTSHVRAQADFCTDVTNPMLVLGYGAEQYDRERWRPFFRLPLQLALGLSPQDLRTLIHAKEKEFTSTTRASVPAVARN